MLKNLPENIKERILKAILQNSDQLISLNKEVEKKVKPFCDLI